MSNSKYDADDEDTCVNCGEYMCDDEKAFGEATDYRPMHIDPRKCIRYLHERLKEVER